jgi:hypothetical protein
MKTTTQKQLAATQKAFKPILTYLEQQQKLAAALKALADKKTTFETERQTIIRQAGTIEAQSLLGDSTPEGGNKPLPSTCLLYANGRNACRLPKKPCTSSGQNWNSSCPRNWKA